MYKNGLSQRLGGVGLNDNFQMSFCIVHLANIQVYKIMVYKCDDSMLQ